MKINFSEAIKSKALWLAFAVGVVVGAALGSSFPAGALTALERPCSIQITAADVLHTPATLLDRCNF